jgi:L-threonylcarbamoyladenylate synthase
MRIFSSDQIQLAADLLKKGELVAFPTETVYGLGAPVFDEAAIEKIFHVKGRPADNPLIVHIAHLDQVKQIAVDIPEEFYALAEKFFPGPLTIVLKKHPSVPSIVSGGLETIAIRMPRHPIAQQLILAIGQPLVAPSANLSGKPSSTTAKHVIGDFIGKIRGVIDGGPTEYGIESTVVNLVSETPCLLRPGTILREEIEEVLGRLLREAHDGEKASSPGMRYKHYAPKAPLRLFNDRVEFVAYLQYATTRYLMSEGLKSSELYALLRRADDEKYEEVVIYCSPEMLQDPALMDRLHRASQPE